MSDLTSTGFVVTKMQILTMQDGCKYRGSTHSSFQFKLRRRQRKVAPLGHVILFSEFIWVKKWSESLLLDRNKQNYRDCNKIVFGWYINTSLSFRNKVFVVNYCSWHTINCLSPIESFFQTNIHFIKNNNVVLQLYSAERSGFFYHAEWHLALALLTVHTFFEKYWEVNPPSAFYWLVMT